MPDIVSHSKLDALKTRLAHMASSAALVAPQVSDAIRSVLTAVDYADKSLLESSLDALLSCLTDVARDIIERELTASELTKEGIKHGWMECVEGIACESFDELKNVIDSLIDQRISSMTKTQDELVRPLEKREYRIENAQRLEDSIRDLRRFRESILKDWPSPRKHPSPINRREIAEARAAIARGEKGIRKHELIWGESPQGETR